MVFLVVFLLLRESLVVLHLLGLHLFQSGPKFLEFLPQSIVLLLRLCKSIQSAGGMSVYWFVPMDLAFNDSIIFLSV